MPPGATYDRGTASNLGTGRLTRRAQNRLDGERRVAAPSSASCAVDLFRSPTTAQPRSGRRRVARVTAEALVVTVSGYGGPRSVVGGSR